MHKESINLKSRRLFYLTEGLTDAPRALVFLHGFPDSPEVWRHQFAYFKNKYRLVASFAPGLEQQKLERFPNADELAMDYIELCEELGIEEAILVVHDLGGPVAGRMLRLAPRLVTKCIFINSPTLEQMYFRKKYFSQLLKSSYILLFQVPEVTKKVLRLIWPTLQKKILQDNKINSPEHLHSKQVLESIYLYRSFFKEIPKLAKLGILKTEGKCVFIWGERDPYLNVPTSEELDANFNDYQLEVIPGHHWLQLEKPDAINKIIQKYLD